MSRCYTIRLPDGTHAFVRTSRGRQPSEADIKAIQQARQDLLTFCKVCKLSLWRCQCGDAA